ncbi:MAG: amino acid racemase [Bacillota bacterium]
MAEIIGILGGMGPEATCDLFHKIIRVTVRFKPVVRDQDHLRVIVDSNPLIPDRTAAILGNGEDPVPALQETARNLERAGAGLIAVPCNTAHYFWDQIQAAARIPVLHMMQEVARALAADEPGPGGPGGLNPGVTRVGLLATTATVRTGLYHRALGARGMQLVVPDAARQESVMEAISRVKRGDLEGARQPLVAAARALEAAGAEAIIEGCTEIPLVLRDRDVGVPLLDATWVLAAAAVRTALGQGIAGHPRTAAPGQPAGSDPGTPAAGCTD